MKLLAVMFWLLCGLAFLYLRNGNPSAINGVIGAGACGLAFSVLAVVERR